MYPANLRRSEMIVVRGEGRARGGGGEECAPSRSDLNAVMNGFLWDWSLEMDLILESSL